jgi:hypothetical protein
VGGLANTDGAILMDTGFNVIGFSSEIVLAKCSRENADKQMLTLSGPLLTPDDLSNAKPLLNAEDKGMRHRSAIQLSLALNNAAIFVVSQDGNVSLLWDQDGRHYFWEDFDPKSFPFNYHSTLAEGLELDLENEFCE